MTSSKQLSPETFDLLQIRWIDSFCSQGVAWEDAESYETNCHDILTVGYYLEQNERYIIVAQSRGDAEDSGQYGSIWRIPVSCVLKIDNLSK